MEILLQKETLIERIHDNLVNYSREQLQNILLWTQRMLERERKSLKEAEDISHDLEWDMKFNDEDDDFDWQVTHTDLVANNEEFIRSKINEVELLHKLETEIIEQISQHAVDWNPWTWLGNNILEFLERILVVDVIQIE